MNFCYHSIKSTFAMPGRIPTKSDFPSSVNLSITPREQARTSNSTMH